MIMTKKDKQLLFKDLCSRLPYHVRVKVWLEYGDTEEGPLDLQHNYGDVLLDAFYYKKIKKIKPYLRPMSSMTEDEHNDWFQYYHNAETEELNKSGDYFKAAMSGDNAKYDWMNAHHFDYRGLIELGIALNAPEGMYSKENMPKLK